MYAKVYVGTGVALYKGITCFQKRLDGEEIDAKKCENFRFLVLFLILFFLSKVSKVRKI